MAGPFCGMVAHLRECLLALSCSWCTVIRVPQGVTEGTPMANISTAIANEFIRLAANEGKQVTQMHLQKLAYIAQGWNLAINHVPLISDEVEAWDYGPVFPILYDHTKYFGSGPITRAIKYSDNNKIDFFFGKDNEKDYVADLDDNERTVIESVWKKYGKYTAFRLSDLTHRPGTPWYETYFSEGKSARIPNERIRSHYRELASRVL